MRLAHLSTRASQPTSRSETPPSPARATATRTRPV